MDEHPDISDREAQLRSRLGALVDAGPDPRTRLGAIDERLRSDRRSHLARRRFLAGAAAVTGLAGAGLLGRAVVRDERDIEVSTDPADGVAPPDAPGTDAWEQVPPAPLRARTGQASVWAGDVLFVWGGNWNQVAWRSAATWSPGERRWEGLDDAPVGSVAPRAFAVWDGREVLVGMGEADPTAPWNGPSVTEEDAGYGLLAYDPAARSWRNAAVLARDVEVRRSGTARQAVLLSDGRLLVGVTAAWPDGGRPEDLRIIDPSTGTSEPVDLGPFAEAPYPDSSGKISLTAAGDHVLALPNWDRRPWVLDVATGIWRHLEAPSGGRSLHLGGAVAMGDRVMIAEAASTGHWILDPGETDPRVWTPVSERPFPLARWRYDPVWTGTEVLTPGAGYDPETDTWREIPAPPRGADRQRSPHALWADDALILFGGEEYTCPDDADCDREPGPEAMDGWILRDQ